MARMARHTEVNECRQCGRFCDRVIDPGTCVAQACPSLYQYDDPLSGRRYMGCLHKVFAVEIDVQLFWEAERTRTGFGTVKVASPPLKQCQFSVEQAFSRGDGDDFRCVNPRFLDWPDVGPDAVRAFDLRDHCWPA
jgi:hypothetical protein